MQGADTQKPKVEVYPQEDHCEIEAEWSDTSKWWLFVSKVHGTV